MKDLTKSLIPICDFEEWLNEKEKRKFNKEMKDSTSL